MLNHMLALTVTATFGWLFVNAPPPEATTPVRSERSAATVRPVSGVNYRQDQPTFHRAPVPLVRVAKVPVATAPSAQEPPSSTDASAEVSAREELDRRAAKAAVEADGYRRVSVVGKTGTGAWRAKAYRGTTEVRLTVDGTGRVSQD
jgi:hypothetical protein